MHISLLTIAFPWLKVKNAACYHKNMKQIKTNNAMIVVLDRGEELHDQLRKVTELNGLKAAWLSGLGGAMNVTLGFYDITTKSYQWKEFDEPLEIVSLTGNLSSKNGEPFWHVHGGFSGAGFNAVSGHVKQLTIGLTGELYIQPFDAELVRSHDETTGLELL